MEFTQEMVHKATIEHLQDYANFMNEVLELETVFGLPRQECMDIVIKRYPQLLKN